MDNYNVLGFGGVRFVYTPYGTTATFPYSFGTVSFEPEFTELKNPNKKIFRRFDGYRIICDVILYSVDSNSYQELQTLIFLINQAQSTNSGLYIYPNYSADNAINLRLDGMLLDSDFGLLNLAKREGLQKLELEFISEELISSIPSFVNAPEQTFVTESGDTIVDSDGNTIIFG